MNKPYKKEYTFTDLLWSIIELIRDLFNVFSKELAERFYSFCVKYLPKKEEEEIQKPVPSFGIGVEEEAKAVTPSEEKPVITHVPTPEETKPYIDRGPLLPEHYGDDRIIALTKDPRCIFVYWDLKGSESQETLNHYKEAKSWFLRVHHLGEDAFYDVPINVDTWKWYLPVEEDKAYIISLGFNTQDGEFLTIATSNPAHTPRAGTSLAHTERWGLIFKEAEKAASEGVARVFPSKRKRETTEDIDIEWIFHGGRWYEGWLEAHVAGSTSSQTQKKGQGK